MRTKAALLALAGEALSFGALIWIFSATLLRKDAPDPMPGLWYTLLLTAANTAVFLFLLRKEIRIPVLAAASAVLFAGNITVQILLYRGSMGFGYVMTVLLISAICVFVPLYYTINEMPLTKHLIVIDVMLLALVWLFLFLPVIRIDTFSVVCAVAVILIDVGGAVCLRMSEGGMNEGTGAAFALAMGASAVAGVIIFLLVKLFSRSSGVTGAVLLGIRAFFRAIWRGIEAFAAWLSQFISATETEAVPEAAPAMSGAENEIELSQYYLDPTAVLAVLGIAAAIAVLVLVYRLRRKRTGLSIGTYGKVRIVRQKNRKKRISVWKKMLEKLIFKKNAFIYRNTPPGVLVWLEKLAAKEKMPRGRGESVREFIFRLSPEGTLAPLAADLDAGLYGNKGYRLTAEECRELKKSYRSRLRNKSEGGN